MIARVGQHANPQVLNCLTRNRRCELQLAEGSVGGDVRYGDRAELKNISGIAQDGTCTLTESLGRLYGVNQNCNIKQLAHPKAAQPQNLPPRRPTSASTSPDRGSGSYPSACPEPFLCGWAFCCGPCR